MALQQRGDILDISNTSILSKRRGIRRNYRTNRIIRQVDLATTICALLGVRVPDECEDAPVYQILKEAEE